MYSYFKRFFDLFFAVILGLITLPLMLISILLIWLLMGRPVFFVQNRIGKNNKEFRLFKFRSMKLKSEKYQTEAERITVLGKFMRDFRIDELPQLYNILRGDMSFIGPRPLLPEYLQFYTTEELKRHTVRPGLSGLSQINHLNYPDWDTQFKDDVAYVERLALKTDLFIIIKTINRMLKPNSMRLTNSKQRPNFIEYRKNQTTSQQTANNTL
jgi:lipopolysaccharide/colanic/teichoic acid biosynthesis glycosyltransferase